MTDLNEKNAIERSREHLANERTFLAWVRTSIALMGFGFVIVKFALFLKQISFFLETPPAPSKGYSPLVGIIMVALGLIIAILAFVQYKKTERQLNRNAYVSASILTILITFIIMVGGTVLILYLLSSIS